MAFTIRRNKFSQEKAACERLFKYRQSKQLFSDFKYRDELF